VELTKGCYDWIAEKGYSPVFGAREIGRLIQEKLKKLFIDEVLFGKLAKGGNAKIKLKNDDLHIEILEKAQDKRKKSK
jgi:ATP-dependent Clp protease ATP-binding subunit ClpA